MLNEKYFFSILDFEFYEQKSVSYISLEEAAASCAFMGNGRQLYYGADSIDLRGSQ